VRRITRLWGRPFGWSACIATGILFGGITVTAASIVLFFPTLVVRSSAATPQTITLVARQPSDLDPKSENSQLDIDVFQSGLKTTLGPFGPASKIGQAREDKCVDTVAWTQEPQDAEQNSVLCLLTDRGRIIELRVLSSGARKYDDALRAYAVVTIREVNL
jgi:hypothetical protein